MVSRFVPGQSPAPAEDFFAVVPHASTDFTYVVRGIYVGVAGDVVAVTEANTPITFKAVPAGTILPIRARRVNAVGTTATDMVGLL